MLYGNVIFKSYKKVKFGNTIAGCEEKIWIVSWLTLRDCLKRFGHKPSVGDMNSQRTW